MIRISAIVSVYRGARFLRGRLDDLRAQTAYERGELEIIVVNAGNRENEDKIVREYLTDPKITYIRSLREPIYSSWNRGIRIAQGEYITNANVDDRLHPNVLSIMANVLDKNPGVGLVYCDAIVTSTENAAWSGEYQVSQKPPYFGKLAWPDYEPQRLLKAYFGGPSPMWRRALHDRYGLFDESYQLAADYEWSLRLAAMGVEMKHIPQALSLFYDDGAGINNAEHSAMETRRALMKWGRYING